MSNVLTNSKYKCSVSSVLNRDVKQHGKQYLFDGCDDTAWSSDQGVPQYINIQFDEPITIKSIGIQFQGGFVGKNCNVSLETAAANNTTQQHNEPFYPDDINAIQMFNLTKEYSEVTKIKLTFDGSTDFFGRLIIYQLEIY